MTTLPPDRPQNPGAGAPTAGAATDLGAEPRSVSPSADSARAEGARSLADVVSYLTGHSLLRGEAELLHTLAEVAHVALLHAEARARLETEVKQLNAFYRISEALSEMTDEGAILETAANKLVSEAGYLNAWIATVDAEAHLLRERALGGTGDYPGRVPTAHSLDRDDGMTIEALRLGRPVSYDDIQERADAEGWGEVARRSGLRSAGYVPLRAGGRILGVLSIGSREAHVSDSELSLLGAFGNQLASTLSRAQMDREREKQIAALEGANAKLVGLIEMVRELSTPVIPVHDGVLVLPLVGTIDSVRSDQVMESLLSAIQRDGAAFVILDITGVPMVDTAVADHLLRSTRAAALLGATCVLVGVAPAVAQTLVGLGVDLGALVLRSNLQAGIAYALERLGRGAARKRLNHQIRLKK